MGVTTRKFSGAKNFINSQIFKKEFEEEFYNGKALILVDCSNDEVFISKRKTHNNVLQA